ncbi:hypothetical protein RB601_002874 [Gaeumannomyces tritici]
MVWHPTCIYKSRASSLLAFTLPFFLPIRKPTFVSRYTAFRSSFDQSFVSSFQPACFAVLHTIMSLKSVSLLTLAALAPLAVAVPTSSVLEARDMPRPLFGSVPWGSRLGLGVSPCTTPGKIALTFDDGPGSLTKTIVDTLQSEGVKATFFIVGENGPFAGLTRPAYHDLVKFMHKEGHQLASHTFSHPDLTTISRAEIKEQLVKNEAIFADVLGFVPTYFRPPYTACDEQCYSVLKELAYHVVDYNLDTLDWDVQTNSDTIFTQAMSSANPATNSYISLSHDVQEFTANGFVKRMIDQARAKGLKFVTVGECLGDPAANWYRDPVTGEPFGSVKPPVSSSTSTVKPTTTANPTTTVKPTTTVSPTSTVTPTTTANPTPHYGNGTIVTATHTSYTTYCPPDHPTSGFVPLPPAPTGTTKTPIPGPHTVIMPVCPGCPKPTQSAPFPTGGKPGGSAPHGTGAIVKPPTDTGAPKPPPVTAGAGRVAFANVAAASLFAAAAWLAL